jgi:hypothetical protein
MLAESGQCAKYNWRLSTVADLEFFPIYRELEQRLTEQDFGTPVEAKGLVGRIADRPIAFRLRDVLAAMGVEIPKEVDLYQQFELWLVPGRISVFRERGLAEVVSLGLECEFRSDGGTLCVVEVLPGPAFIRHGSVEGDFTCRGSVSASGDLRPLPDTDPGHPTAGAEEPLRIWEKQGLRFETRARGGVQMSFSFVVTTPYVHAVGTGSGRSQWRFDMHREPLFGRDMQMWTVLALPKEQRELIYRARMFITVRTAFFPTRRESDWQEVRCVLES